MSRVLTLYRTLSPWPLGRLVFSTAFSLTAPYFRTVRPRFTVLEPDHVELIVADRWGVHNHLGTVHAIALCNGLEAAMGALAEVSISAHRRWIPKGMEVEYTAKATGDVTCIARTRREQWTGEAGDLPVQVHGELADGTVVVRGEIRLWVTEKAPSVAH